MSIPFILSHPPPPAQAHAPDRRSALRQGAPNVCLCPALTGCETASNHASMKTVPLQSEPAVATVPAAREEREAGTPAECPDERGERLRNYQTPEFREALQRHMHEAKKAALRDAGRPFE